MDYYIILKILYLNQSNFSKILKLTKINEENNISKRKNLKIQLKKSRQKDKKGKIRNDDLALGRVIINNFDYEQINKK